MEGIYKVECIEKKNYKKYLFSDEQKQDIVSKYNQYIPISDIAKQYNVTDSTIYKVLKSNGVTLRGHKKTGVEEDTNKIIDLYKQGYTQNEIAIMYGVSGRTIGKLLIKNNASELGTACKNKPILFSNEDIEKMIIMYSNGISTRNIGIQFGCDPGTVVKNLELHGVEMRHRKYELNEHYFDEIDTPNKAYILGFLYADGANCVSNSIIRMSLQARDRDILERIRLEIGCEKPLRFIDGSNKKGFNAQDQYELMLSSSHMCNVLESKGMVRRKSLVVQWPKFLKDGLYSHFLRGVIDGDGTINKSKKHHVVSFLSTYDFCNDALVYIEDKLGIKCHVYKDVCKNGITSSFSISRKNDVKTFLDWIYQDADLYLERKHNIYISKYYPDNINNTLIA